MTLTKANTLDAGYDLVADNDYTIEAGEITRVGTTVRGDVPPGTVGLVCPRSGLAAKHGLTIINAPGVLDAGFTGRVEVIMTKIAGRGSYEVKKGDRIAQLVYLPLSAYIPGATSDRGDSGFGSSGR